MSNDSKIAGKLKAQITRWANGIGEGLWKVDRRWVREMVYGIQASEDVKLSNVARSLGEENALIEVEQRLSRQTSLRDRSEMLNDRMCMAGASRVGEETVLAVDVGDLQKRYGKKMECLAEVRDGSTGEIGRGYWLLNVIGADVDSERVVPLYQTLYSQEAEGWESENTEILRAMERVSRNVKGRGIWAIDRGGDRPAIYNYLLGGELRFVIRVEGRRHVRLPDGEKVSVRELGRRCGVVEKHSVTVEIGGKREKGFVTLGAMRVRLCWRKEWLWLVVVKGALPGQQEDPILLLTNGKVLPKGGKLRRILDIFLTRWKCEESWRFVKQAYHLEDVRVRSYVGLRNIVAVVGLVFYFVSVELGRKVKLNLLLKRIYERAERFYEVVGFKMYAIADGIHRILFGYRPRIEPEPDTPVENQLLINFNSLPP